MRTHIFSALILSLLLLVLCSFAYTASVLGLAQLAPNHGGGAVVEQNGHRYYANIGQSFSSERYFWSRPSAVGYNAAGSAGSNKGPTNPEYLAVVQARIDTLLVHHPGVTAAQIPADLVTASGSGLDPHISPRSALLQVERVARVRNLPVEQVIGLVESHTEGPWLGVFGPSRVNVLLLNLALDRV